MSGFIGLRLSSIRRLPRDPLALPDGLLPLATSSKERNADGVPWEIRYQVPIGAVSEAKHSCCHVSVPSLYLILVLPRQYYAENVSLRSYPILKLFFHIFACGIFSTLSLFLICMCLSWTTKYNLFVSIRDSFVLKYIYAIEKRLLTFRTCPRTQI